MNNRHTFKLLDILKESREFGEFLDSHEKIWQAKSARQQARRVPGVSQQGNTPSPVLGITRADLGGPQGVQRLRQSTRPEAELDKLISTAERDRDIDRAGRLIDFKKEFALQRSEINVGLRQQFQDLNTVNKAVYGLDQPSTRERYLEPLQSVQAKADARSEQDLTVRKNADDSISTQVSGVTPSYGREGSDGYSSPVQSARDRIRSLKASNPTDPLIQTLTQKIDQYKSVGGDSELDKDQKDQKRTPIKQELQALLARAPKEQETSQRGGGEQGGSTPQGRTTPQIPLRPSVSAQASSDPSLDDLKSDLDSLGVDTAPKAQKAEPEKTTKADKKEKTDNSLGSYFSKTGSSSTKAIKPPRKSKAESGKLQPFKPGRNKDSNLESQVDLASKRVSSIREKMKDLINQLKKEKNPIIKERLQRMMENLDRQLGVSYITLERLKKQAGLTTQINVDNFNNLRDVFRETEKLSIEASDYTNKYPAVLQASDKVKRKDGESSLDQFFGGKTQEKREKSKDKELTDEDIFDAALTVDDFDKAQEIMDLMDDEIQELVNAEDKKKKEPKKTAEIDKGQTERKARNKKNKTPALSGIEAAELYTSAIKDMRTELKTAKGPQKRSMEMAMALMQRAMTERLSGPSKPQEPYTMNYKNSMEYLNDDPNIKRIVNSVAGATQDETENVDDLIDRIEDNTRTLDKADRYYTGLLLANAFNNQKELITKVLSEPGEASSKKTLKAIIRKVDSLKKQQPLEMDPEVESTGKNTFNDLATGYGEKFKNKNSHFRVDTLAMPSDNVDPGPGVSVDRTTANSENQYTPPRMIKTGDELVDSMFAFLIRGKNKKNMPDDDLAIINTIKKFGRGEKLTDADIVHDGSLDVDFQTSPSVDALRQELEFNRGKNLRDGDLERVDKAMTTKARERAERRDQKKKSKKTSDEGVGSLAGMMEWFQWAHQMVAENDPQWIYEMRNIGRWAKEINEASRLYIQLHYSKSYIAESSNRCWDRPAADLLRKMQTDIEFFCTESGYQQFLQFNELYEQMPPDERLRYRLAEVKFKQHNQYYWLSEKFTICLGESQSLLDESYVPTNPLANRIAKENVELESERFYKALIEESENQIDNQSEKAAEQSSKQARRSSVFKGRRDSNVEKAQTKQMSEGTGRKLLSLREFKRA